MKIRHIVYEIVKRTKLLEAVNDDDKLVKLGISSFEFVEILVEIENNLNIELPDEFLLLDAEMTVSKLYNYISELCENSI